MKPGIAEALKLHEQRAFTRRALFISVALELAESGTPEDVAELPVWLRKELFDWADEFEKPPQSWQIVSNAGSRDVTEQGKKLLALLRRIQSGTR